MTPPPWIRPCIKPTTSGRVESIIAAFKPSGNIRKLYEDKIIKNAVVSTIRASKAMYFSDVYFADTKIFWKKVKLLSKHKYSIPTVTYNGVSFSTDLN